MLGPWEMGKWLDIIWPEMSHHDLEQVIERMKIFFFRTDPKKLEENGITHIVSILSSMQYKKSDKSEKVKTIKVITKLAQST